MTNSEKLYELMDWAEIEALVYSEENAPREILGPRVTRDGILIQAYIPGETSLKVHCADAGAVYDMTMEDESGFFAALLPGKEIPKYTFLLEDGREFGDPYAFPCQITEKEETRFGAGIWYDSYTKLGAHPMKINDTEGVYFAVWAPNAERVSIVGDFNHWDGRIFQMNKLKSGIFELFVPGVGADVIYKYEIKLRNNLVYLKADPYASMAQQMPETASVVADTTYEWNDKNWISIRKAKQAKDAPIFACETDFASIVEAVDSKHTSENDKLNESSRTYATLAPAIRDNLLNQGYTHLELMPLLEYPDDASRGYSTSGFFALTSRYGTPKDFKVLVDTLHQAGIGVILDFPIASFARGEAGLESFDGTCLYEHKDPKRGVHPQWNTPVFDYSKPEVTTFLISAALQLLQEYHVDGLRINNLASMLYLDYERNDGEWIANMYGGNENLEAIELLKHMNSIVKQKASGALMIAEDSSGWPMLTGNLQNGGLGFDYVWNHGWTQDYLQYIQLDPYFRGAHQDDLTFSTVYAYSENFMLSLSHDVAADGQGSMLSRMPGAKPELKLANLRLSLAYMLAHPGKKLLHLDVIKDAVEAEKAAGAVADVVAETVDKAAHAVSDKTENTNIVAYITDLVKLYTSHPALFKLDRDPEGFEWISNLDWERNLLIFLRKTDKKEETMLIVCNFSNVAYEDFLVGVPYEGKYKEVLNTDAVAYGGSGVVNPRVKASKKLECDEREYSIKVKVPPLGVSFYQFSEAVEKRTDNKSAKAKKPAATSKKGLKEDLEKKMQG